MNPSNQKPRPWKSAPLKDLKKIKGVCLDIDDTLSTDGKLTSEAFSALWNLKRAGFAVVPITGRPAGWCDHFARFWPVDAVVGENGAFTYFMQNGIRRKITTPAELSEEAQKDKLLSLRKEILESFENAKWASDQAYREYDLAVDICEDVEPWPHDRVQALLEFCKSRGAHAKLSSIHVNIWFGQYDKRKGFEYWLNQGQPGWKGKKLKQSEWLYIGDSPNDEPMFACFPFSVGVANLKAYLSMIKTYPKWMTQSKSGLGFVEMSRRLIQAKKN